MDALPSINQKLTALFQHVRDHHIPLYVLIDEYDNFANTILSEQGAEAYHAFTHGGGFYRNFFGTLKGGTAEAGGIERLFVTGVSPVTMDDVTSGFNIATNISLLPEFNEMLGFSEDEVRAMLETYRKTGAFREEVQDALATMREWYDGYRFSEDAERDVYNTDMALYYLSESIALRHPPRRLIDRNVRVDYGKLRHLLIVSRREAERERQRRGAAELNGNFDLLRQVIEDEGAQCDLRDGFPLRELGERENFLTLLHCFGLLSIRGTAEGRTHLGMPNEMAKHLSYSILRDAYSEAGRLSVDIRDFTNLVHEMAYRGVWSPVFWHLDNAVERHAGIRDRPAGEKTIQGFLATYLTATNHFLLHSERELGDGYADIWLEPNAAAHPEAPNGYLLELKWLKPSAKRRTSGRAGAGSNRAAAPLPGGRDAGAAAPEHTLRRPGARVPRLETGPRGSGGGCLT